MEDAGEPPVRLDERVRARRTCPRGQGQGRSAALTATGALRYRQHLSAWISHCEGFRASLDRGIPGPRRSYRNRSCSAGMTRSRRRAVAGDVEPPDDRGRDPLGLPHHELRGGRDLVGERDHGRVQLVAGRVVLAARGRGAPRSRPRRSRRSRSRAARRARTCRVTSDAERLAGALAPARRAARRPRRPGPPAAARPVRPRARSTRRRRPRRRRSRGASRRSRAAAAARRIARRLAQDDLELARVAVRRPARGPAREGSTSASAHDAPLRLRDRPSARRQTTSPSSSAAAPAISAARSSPSAISGRPSTGMTEITRASHRRERPRARPPRGGASSAGPSSASSSRAGGPAPPRARRRRRRRLVDDEGVEQARVAARDVYG